jgi:outer membrane receptor for ferrienterochelin and colicins
LNDRVFLAFTWFDNSFRDLIDFSADEFRLVNRRKVVSHGAELEARFKVTPAVQLLTHLNYVDADIKESNEPLRDRPNWRGGLGVDWQITKQSQLHLRYTAVGDRFDFQIPVPERTIAESYEVLDAAFSQQITPDITAFIRVDNLLDSDYQEFIGFPNPGLYARGGVSFSFEP